jgi:transcriptional regulator with XRE-family HTH domain
MSDPTPADARPISPGAARRRLGSELRSLRERAGLKLEDAGSHLQRSAATIHRLENAKVLPRLVDIAALLELYSGEGLYPIPPDVRERVLRLAADSRKKQWFEPFRDVITGDMLQAHVNRLVEYETDARDIRTYEPEIIPGLLQTSAYARAVADLFFPQHPVEQRNRFVEFRLARQAMLHRQREPVHLSAVIGESALRRIIGSVETLREQVLSLLDDIRGARPNVEVRVVPISVTVPAVLRGSFIVMSFDGEHDGDLVYLETRTGDDYLQSAADVERANFDFESLVEVSLSQEDAVRFVEHIAATLG